MKYKIKQILKVGLVILSCQTSLSALSQDKMTIGNYALSEEEWNTLLAPLRESSKEAIAENPLEFLNYCELLKNGNNPLLVLVNKTVGLSEDDDPSDIINLDDYKNTLHLSRKGHRFRQIALPSLLKMSEDADKEGLSLLISSSYRPYAYQKKIYNRYVSIDGQEAADRYSARPGFSQHQLGTVIDFGAIENTFATTKAGLWMKKNSETYGFSLSYPKGEESFTGYMWESWHFRYIGVEACEMQRKFFSDSQEEMLRFFHNSKDVLKRSYKK